MREEELEELLAECKEIASLYKVLCEMYRDEVIMLREARTMSYSHSDAYNPLDEKHDTIEEEVTKAIKDTERKITVAHIAFGALAGAALENAAAHLFTLRDDVGDLTLKELVSSKFTKSVRMSTALKRELESYLKDLMEVLER